MDKTSHINIRRDAIDGSDKSEEVYLESAVRWTLDVGIRGETAKPRSRSLIWRPKKSRQNNDVSNCYPS